MMNMVAQPAPTATDDLTASTPYVPTYHYIMKAAFRFAGDVDKTVWQVAVDVVEGKRGELDAQGTFRITSIGTFRVKQHPRARVGRPIVDRHRAVEIEVNVLGWCTCGCNNSYAPCAPRLAREIYVLATSMMREDMAAAQ